MKTKLIPLLALALAACGGGEPEQVDTSSASRPITADGHQPEAISHEAGETWAIATANPHATEAGARILAAGGTAADAAVTVQSVLGLVEPQASGLGGGGFMLYYDAQAGEVTTYDGREAAPYSVGETIYMDEQTGEPRQYPEILQSGDAVGVPSVVAMLDLAHREHGRLDWSALFEDPIRLSREGFEVSPRMAKSLASRAQYLIQDPNARELYFTEDDQPLEAGALFRNEPYALTLEEIAEGGAGAFYSGDIAQSVVDAVNARAGEGHMTVEDIFEYEAMSREPVCGGFVGYTICTMGPPSSALAMIQTLGMLEAHGLPDEPGPELWALYGEAGRLAWADRAEYLGDPTAMGSADIDGTTVAEALVAPDYLAERAKLIGTSAAAEVAAGDPFSDQLEDRAPDLKEEVPGTSHFSIRDSYGDIVSMTGTVEGAFGSWMVASGMILNNELTDFSWVPEIDGELVVNAPGPGKRPRSSMSPSIVLDAEGQPVLAIGSAGGANIIGHVTKTLLLALAYDMPLQEAIDAPHVTMRTDGILIEDTAPQATLDAVEAYGIEYRTTEISSSLQGFRLDDGQVIDVAADPRREGTVMSGKLED